MPRVSVVIPTWNRAAFLGRTLESVMRQTEEDFEVLVVDDHSEDGAAEGIVRNLGDPRFRYIRLPEHRGVGAARNAGIAESKSPYIAFLDDDDEWFPEKLAVQLRVLEAASPSVGGVYSARLSVFPKTGRTVTERFPKPFTPWGGNPLTTSSVVVRRGCFDIVGMFDERLTAGGDWDMWLRIATRFRFEYIDEVLVKYLAHAQSITGNRVKHVASREIILTKHADLFARHPRSYARRYRTLARRYQDRGEMDKARRAFRTSIRIWPYAAEAYVRFLLCYPPLSLLRRLCRAALPARLARSAR